MPNICLTSIIYPIISYEAPDMHQSCLHIPARFWSQTESEHQPFLHRNLFKAENPMQCQPNPTMDSVVGLEGWENLSMETNNLMCHVCPILVFALCIDFNYFRYDFMKEDVQVLNGNPTS